MTGPDNPPTPSAPLTTGADHHDPSPGRGCVFCAIIAGHAPARIAHTWDHTLAIHPRHPVTPGHLLVIPRTHVPDIGTDPAVSARTMAAAAQLAADLPAANIITSKGAPATQTQYHLHLHLIPRTQGDGLPLPWTPRHTTHTRTPHPPANITLVAAREPIPAGPSVFLAGPTPRLGDPVESWRPAATAELARQWAGRRPLTVLSPESRDGIRAAHYDDQVDWETQARAASAILFWIPRDLSTLPGFTTNVEFGMDVSTGRAVLGAPPDCANPERNRYLVHVARRCGVPVCETLPDTVAAALAIVTTRTTTPSRRPRSEGNQP